MRFSAGIGACLACIPLMVLAKNHRAEDWPEGSAMHTAYKIKERMESTERELARSHEALIGLVSTNTNEFRGKHYKDERLVAALKGQHDAWLKYRGEECELIGSLSGAGGSWPSTYNLECQSNLTDERLRRVRSATRCLEKLPPDNRFSEQRSCLYQLAPLATKK